MAQRNIHLQTLHDNVVMASRQTYAELEKQGYKVSINPDGEQNQSVGGVQQYYPDVIVWKPSAENPTKGTAIIIEEIETEDSVNSAEVQEWVNYANLGVSKFCLIVPGNRVQEALRLIQLHNIGVTEIWYYSPSGSSFTFTKYISLR